jgi:mRNA interferase MazF
MQNTITYRFGDVLLVPFPFTDQTTHKKRPTVVISSDNYNQHRPDLILIAVTSQVSTVLQFGEMPITNWSTAGLLKLSVVKPIVTTIEKKLVLRKLGQLDNTDRKTLKLILQQILETI